MKLKKLFERLNRISESFFNLGKHNFSVSFSLPLIGIGIGTHTPDPNKFIHVNGRVRRGGSRKSVTIILLLASLQAAADG